MFKLGIYLSAGFYSTFLYRRLYRCHTSLSGFSFDDGNVERKKVLTREEFDHQCGGMEPVCCETSVMYGIHGAFSSFVLSVIVITFHLFACFQKFELFMFT